MDSHGTYREFPSGEVDGDNPPGPLSRGNRVKLRPLGAGGSQPRQRSIARYRERLYQWLSLLFDYLPPTA